MTGRTVLLLGCGPVGLATARLLGNDKSCDRVITLDRSWERAAAAAERCGAKAVPFSGDCTDDECLRRLLGDATLVVNTIRFTTGTLIPLIRAVVEAGVSYTDVTSALDTLQSVFDSEYLHGMARHRSVGAVPGLGVSPGLTNALASYLTQRLERVDAVRFYLEDDISHQSPRQWRERLAAFGSPALVWRNRRWKYVEPMSEWKDVTFPNHSATVSCCTVNLEPVTLPYSFPSLEEVSCHRGFTHETMCDVVKNLVRYGLASDETLETRAGPVSPLEFASTLFGSGRANWTGEPFGQMHGPGNSATSLERQVRVSGVLQGKKTEFTMSYYFPGEKEEDSIAATLSTGVRMLLSRELPAPGLYAPEALDPAPFLWDMERRGVEIRLTKTVED